MDTRITDGSVLDVGDRIVTGWGDFQRVIGTARDGFRFTGDHRPAVLLWSINSGERIGWRIAAGRVEVLL